MILHFYIETPSSAQEKLELLSASYVRRHSRDHHSDDSVQSKLLPLSVSASPVPRLACSKSCRMALVRPLHHDCFELAFRIPPRPQIPSPLNTLFHGKTALSLSVILDIPQVRDTSGRPRVTRARKSVGLRGARRPDGRFPSKCTPPPIPTTNPGPKRPSTFRARRIQPKLHTNSKLL